LKWKNLYLLAHESGDGKHVLVGIAGIAPSSNEDGTVLVGISVLQDEMKRGITTEAFKNLTEWALEVTRSRKAVCDIPVERKAVASTLERVDYKRTNVVPSPGFCPVRICSLIHYALFKGSPSFGSGQTSISGPLFLTLPTF
jgi:RimJ/RimL family protein N-acetyltransferase